MYITHGATTAVYPVHLIKGLPGDRELGHSNQQWLCVTEVIAYKETIASVII